MADKPRWFTTQFRVREDTHEWLKAEAASAGISVTQAAGALIDYACKHGWQIGPVEIVRQPSAIVTKKEQPDV
jgi:hypothetical protein